jgi:hypothetical protein
MVRSDMLEPIHATVVAAGAIASAIAGVAEVRFDAVSVSRSVWVPEDTVPARAPHTTPIHLLAGAEVFPPLLPPTPDAAPTVSPAMPRLHLVPRPLGDGTAGAYDDEERDFAPDHCKSCGRVCVEDESGVSAKNVGEAFDPEDGDD